MFGHDPANEGKEVQTIRREAVNSFADWQAENNVIASSETDDPKPLEAVVPPVSDREKEVLESFCILSRSVMNHVFRYRESADCLCPQRPRHPLLVNCFEYSPKVFDYIREAVFQRMQKEGAI